MTQHQGVNEPHRIAFPGCEPRRFWPKRRVEEIGIRYHYSVTLSDSASNDEIIRAEFAAHVRRRFVRDALEFSSSLCDKGKATGTNIHKPGLIVSIRDEFQTPVGEQRRQ